MSITFEANGSVTLRGEADPSRTLLIPASRSPALRDAAIVEFFADDRPVPGKVTNYQARQALIDAGLFAQADAAVRASGDPSTIQAWDYANEFFRASRFVGALGAGLNLSPAQIDELFRQAEQVP